MQICGKQTGKTKQNRRHHQLVRLRNGKNVILEKGPRITRRYKGTKRTKKSWRKMKRGVEKKLDDPKKMQDGYTHRYGMAAKRKRLQWRTDNVRGINHIMICREDG